jgi:hypothetical protein
MRPPTTEKLSLKNALTKVDIYNVHDPIHQKLDSNMLLILIGLVGSALGYLVALSVSLNVKDAIDATVTATKNKFPRWAGNLLATLIIIILSTTIITLLSNGSRNLQIRTRLELALELFMERCLGYGTASRSSTPDKILLFGTETVDVDINQEVLRTTGCMSTLYAKTATGFVAQLTTLQKATGDSAQGDTLNAALAKEWSSGFKQGKCSLNGHLYNFMSEPVLDASKNVIGFWWVGLNA